MRINKFLASSGVCSRRKADELISAGRVVINQKIAMLGDQVNEGDDVLVDGKPVRQKTQKIYLVFHKPFGMITTMDPSADNSVASAIKTTARVFPVGRLDVESSGLLLLTNDGELSQQLTHAKFGHEKEYEVGVDRKISDEDLMKFSQGMELSDGKTSPCKVRRLGAEKFSIILTEGRNRQIRRMCETLGYQVRFLHRVRFGTLNLGDLPAGKWRELTVSERQQISPKK